MDNVNQAKTPEQSNYFLSTDKNKIYIKLRHQSPILNKILLALFFIWFIAYSFYKTYSNPNIPMWVFFFILIIGIIAASIGLFLSRNIFLNGSTREIILNKKRKTIEFLPENFKLPLSNIKNITIIEKQTFFKPVYFLKLHLIDGEKTITYPFTTYKEAQNFLNLLKNHI